MAVHLQPPLFSFFFLFFWGGGTEEGLSSFSFSFLTRWPVPTPAQVPDRCKLSYYKTDKTLTATESSRLTVETFSDDAAQCWTVP